MNTHGVTIESSGYSLDDDSLVAPEAAVIRSDKFRYGVTERMALSGDPMRHKDYGNELPERAAVQ